MPIPPHSRSKEAVVKDFRTGEILDAARRVIAELGYGEASMDRIAHAASVAKGTLYLYFKSKESLLVEVLERGFAELQDATRARTLRARGTTAKLRELALTFLEHSALHQDFYRALLESPELGPDGASAVSRRFRLLIDAYIAYVGSIVERGTRAGELRAVDPARAARFLVEVLRGVVADRMRESAPPSAGDDADAVLDFFFRGVGAGERK